MAADPLRQDLLLAAMQHAGLDALCAFSPTDVLLLTGYWPVMGVSMAVLTRSGRCAVLIPSDDHELASATTTADLVPYQPGSLHNLDSLPETMQEPLQRLAARLDLPPAARIGVDRGDGFEGNPYQSVNHFRSDTDFLVQWLHPGGLTVPSHELFRDLRGSRSPLEVDHLRRACTLAETGFDAAHDAIQPGRREDEVAADIESAFNRVALSGFHRARGFFFCMSGPNSALAAGAYARTRQRVLEPGDFVMIHTNTVGDGAWTDISRTFIVGPPSAQQQAIQDAILRARDAALALIRPGVRASDVDHAARTVLTDAGFGKLFPHALGHGVGFAATDPHARPRVHPCSSDLLTTGSAFNIEPAVYIDGVGGSRHCDVVVCTESGADVLTPF